MEGMNAAAEVLAYAIAGSLVLLGLVHMRHWLVEGTTVLSRPRPHYITDEELELTGEDYRVHVSDYFRKWSKRKAIVREVCDVDR